MEAKTIIVLVHMLPTMDKSHIGFLDNGKSRILYYQKEALAFREGWYPQHLYFTTDEEIKEGDWYLGYLSRGWQLFQKTSATFKHKIARKIIASTDPKLTVKYDNGVRDFGWETKSISYKKLAQPSQAFIKAYCEQGGIDEVDVEYELIWEETGWNKQSKHKLKVDSHNTITTHRIVEKMYSRENLENLMMQSYIYGQSDKTDSFHKRESTIEKLIKENL